MAIQTRQASRPSNLLNIVIAAGAAAAIAAVALVPFNRDNSQPSPSSWNVGPSFAAEVNESQRFVDEMALHEALTEAQFGPFTVSAASVAARAIAEHDAFFPAVVAPSSLPTISDEDVVALALAQHEALIAPLVPDSGKAAASPSAEVARAIAEHDALLEPFVS